MRLPWSWSWSWLKNTRWSCDVMWAESDIRSWITPVSSCQVRIRSVTWQGMTGVHANVMNYQLSVVSGRCNIETAMLITLGVFVLGQSSVRIRLLWRILPWVSRQLGFQLAVPVGPAPPSCIKGTHGVRDVPGSLAFFLWLAFPAGGPPFNLDYKGAQNKQLAICNDDLDNWTTWLLRASTVLHHENDYG